MVEVLELHTATGKTTGETTGVTASRTTGETAGLAIAETTQYFSCFTYCNCSANHWKLLQICLRYIIDG
jgi:hypothetical protein